MPSPDKRVCVFGDSHFACAKLALDAGLVDTRGIDLEFWGNIGTRFRHLTWRNGQVEALDDFTASRFAMTNAKGRRSLCARDFDAIFFMGCRIDVCRLFPEALHRRRTPALHTSDGVLKRWFGDFMRRQPPYQFAQAFAAQQQAAILVAPVSFDTDGFEHTIPEAFQNARAAQRSDRQVLWNIVDTLMAEDQIALLPQPEETVVAGCCTHPRYAVAHHVDRKDKTHKNSAYGALILNEALDRLRAT
ncbi:MAG: hypothetical protein AAF999_10290 [Pseudomonadota bacterium]